MMFTLLLCLNAHDLQDLAQWLVHKKRLPYVASHAEKRLHLGLKNNGLLMYNQRFREGKRQE
ncbi:TPA: hypothetical protein JA361_12055 [Legionella pneumophila]|nr:hypothetical protein [Legionella pneumophila]HAT8181170.1 hypothetical protein [Legionella pneumophila]